jgi:hypothetical protein
VAGFVTVYTIVVILGDIRSFRSWVSTVQQTDASRSAWGAQVKNQF